MARDPISSSTEGSVAGKKCKGMKSSLIQSQEYKKVIEDIVKDMYEGSFVKGREVNMVVMVSEGNINLSVSACM